MQELPLNIETEVLPSSQKGLNLTGLCKTIKRNILPIAGISSIASTIFWLANSSVPIYTGDFQLLVEPVTSEAKFSQPSTLTSSSKSGSVGSLEMDYSTVITILRSPAMLSAIVEQIQPHYPEFTQKQLGDNLKIERLNLDEYDLSNQTKIIEVTYEDEDSDLVQLVLDRAAERYLSYSLEDRKIQIGQGVEFIEDQLPELNQRIGNLQSRLQNLREQNKFIDPELKGEDLLRQIQKINIEQLETKGELEKLKALENNLSSQLNMTPEEAILASTLSEDENYQQLLQKLKSIESQIATEVALFKTDAPNVRTLYQKRDNLVSLLNQETKKILGGKFDSITQNSPLLKYQNSITLSMTQQLVETTNKAKLLEIQLNSLKNIQNRLEEQSQRLPKISSEYAEIKQELAIANQTLDRLLTQRDALRIELSQSQVPWQVVSSPQLQKDALGNPTPLPQDSQKKLMMSVFGSLCLGVGTIVLFERSRNVFYTPEDIEAEIQSPLLGLIPSSKSRQSEADWEQCLAAFDSLYANIKFRYHELPLGSIVISALEPTEAETETARYLAETVAAMGQKVLLVDANLRSPSLHTQYNLDNKTGLKDLLAESAEMDFHDVVQKSEKTNLFVLTSGEMAADSSRMLASSQMENLNQQFQEAFDLIVYTAPAFLAYMDTSFLAAHTDGVIGVVKIGTTPKFSVQKSLQQIENFELQNLGIIAQI